MTLNQDDSGQSLLRRFKAWIDRRKSRLVLLASTLALCIPIGWLLSDLRHNQTVLVGLIAGLFAWGQWHTARQKLVLDLFEKRLTAYENLRDAVMVCHLSGGPTIQETFAVDRSIHESRCLFDVKTVNALKDLSDDLFTWRTAESKFTRACAAVVRNEAEIEQRMDDAEKAASTFREAANRLDPLMSPYIRLGQKLPLPPSAWPKAVIEWIDERWRLPPDRR